MRELVAHIDLIIREQCDPLGRNPVGSQNLHHHFLPAAHDRILQKQYFPIIQFSKMNSNRRALSQAKKLSALIMHAESFLTFFSIRPVGSSGVVYFLSRSA